MVEGGRQTTYTSADAVRDEARTVIEGEQMMMVLDAVEEKEDQVGTILVRGICQVDWGIVRHRLLMLCQVKWETHRRRLQMLCP